MNWKSQLGIFLATLIIIGVACFFWGRSSVSVEYYEVVRTETISIPSTELNYIAQATLSDVPMKAIPIHILRTVDTVKHPISSLVRVAGFDSLYSDSVHISGEYYFPPVNLFDIHYKPRPIKYTTKWVEQTKLVTKYNWFNHGVVLSVGYSPLSKRVDGFVGYGVMISVQNLFKE